MVRTLGDKHGDSQALTPTLGKSPREASPDVQDKEVEAAETSQDPSSCQGRSSQGISEAGEPPALSLVGEIRHRRGGLVWKALHAWGSRSLDCDSRHRELLCFHAGLIRFVTQKALGWCAREGRDLSPARA